MALRRAVVFWNEPARASFLSPEDNEVKTVHGQGRVAEALSDLECIVGLDPRHLAEALGVSTEGRRFVNLNWLNDGVRPARLTLQELMTSTLGLGRLESLEEGVRALGLLYRFGVQHGWVYSLSEEFGAPWDVGNDVTLTEALGWSVRSGKPVTLWRRGHGWVGEFTAETIGGGTVLGRISQGRVQLPLRDLLVDWREGIDEITTPYPSNRLTEFHSEIPPN